MNKSKKNKKEKRVKNYKKNQSIKKINNSVRGDDANQSRIHSRLGIDIKGPAKKLWGGRFKESTEKLVDEFSSSLSLDKRMWKEDLLGSIAHAEMLVHQKIISKNEGKKIINALNEISLEIEKKVQKGEDPFFRIDAEDVHSAIEQKLYEKIGTTSGKLHTARSRNDQVATDLKLYMRNQIFELKNDLVELQNWILSTSEKHLETLLPGLTHMQHAQPVSLSHHLMAYFWMLQRDSSRLDDFIKRMNSLPLGSAALAGTSFPIDRHRVAKRLEFDSVTENSLDSVSDRDFVIEFLSIASNIMIHLSRWAEEIVLWSMPEFQFIELADSVTTGSSIMPQKKNPDISELIRGRTGRVVGALIGFLTVMKALPLSYQRDLQEDKYHLFEGLDCVRTCIQLMLCQIKKAQFNKDRMLNAVVGDASNATDLADYLAKKGMPFREAHEIVGKIVQFCISNSLNLEELTHLQLKKFSRQFGSDIISLIQPKQVVHARTSEGGTSPQAVLLQIQKARDIISR